MKQQTIQSALTSLDIEASTITHLVESVHTPAFAQTVDCLATCNRIMTCASGTSGIAAKKFAHSLCCIERPAMFMPPGEAVHGGLGALQPGDALVVVSRGGKTDELLPILPVCQKRKALLIGVTENLTSPLASAADMVLRIRVDRESDPLNIMATASFIATVALFDAVLAALIIETGYGSEQFAQIHPGGAVGKHLNTKQSDAN